MPERDGIELPCVSCGYDLRGLSAESACPECGTPVSRSGRGDRLAAADAQWLRRIVRGQRLVALAMMLAVSSMLAAFVLTVASIVLLVTAQNLPRMVEDVMTVVIGIVVLGVPLGLCIGAVGVFLLTAQEGRERERESPWSARNVARWSIVGAVVASALVFPLRWTTAGTTLYVAVTGGKLLLIAFVTIVSVALLRRVGALARRVPSDAVAMRLDSASRFLRWGLPAAAVFVFVLRPMGIMTPIIGAGGLVAVILTFGNCVGFIAVLGMLAVAIHLAVTMRQCAAQFRTCLDEAERA